MSEAICGADTPVQSEARSPDGSEPSAAWRLGDEVQVSPAFVRYADWRGQRLWLCGMTAEVMNGERNYWLSECWPPKHLGDITTDWREGDFLPAFTDLSGSGDGDPATTASSVAPQNPSAREAGRLRQALEAIDAMPRYVWPVPENYLHSLWKRYEKALDIARAALSTETGDQS